MKFSARAPLDLFLWYQTCSLLTEEYQVGLADQAVAMVNAAFILLFLCILARRIDRATRYYAILCGALLAQLLFPATYSLLVSGSVVLLPELIKLAAWMIVLLFSMVVHTDSNKISATLKTLQRCAFFLMAAIVAFQVMGLGETAYGLGVLHLGGIKNEPSVSMFALALMVSFLVRMPGRTQIVGIFGLLASIALLMKRSALMAGVLLPVLGLKNVLEVGSRFRAFVLFVLAGGAIITVQMLDFGELLYSSDLISQRFRDIQKLQEASDLGYLGSGRLGLLQDHLQDFISRDITEQLLGLFVDSTDELALGGYLGLGLHAAAHNDFMEILTRGGYLGLLTFLALLTKIGTRLMFRAERPSDPYLQSVLVAGKLAALTYFLHIFIGVIFKVQFMVVIVVIVGMALRICHQQAAIREKVS